MCRLLLAPSLTLQRSLRSIAADVIVLDWALPQHKAAHLLSVIHQLPGQPRTVVLGSRPYAEQAALAAGADAFVNKNDPPDTVLRMVRFVSVERR